MFPRIVVMNSLYYDNFVKERMPLPLLVWDLVGARDLSSKPGFRTFMNAFYKLIGSSSTGYGSSRATAPFASFTKGQITDTLGIQHCSRISFTSNSVYQHTIFSRDLCPLPTNQLNNSPLIFKTVNLDPLVFLAYRVLI